MPPTLSSRIFIEPCLILALACLGAAQEGAFSGAEQCLDDSIVNFHLGILRVEYRALFHRLFCQVFDQELRGVTARSIDRVLEGSLSKLHASSGMELDCDGIITIRLQVFLVLLLSFLILV